MTTDSQHPPWTPGNPGTRWMATLFLLPVAIWSFMGASLIGVVAALSSSFRNRHYVRWVRIWGRLPLLLSGVRLEVHGEERVREPEPRIIVFNHVSLLDLFVLASLCPPRALVIYKKEFGRVPGLGRALRDLGMIPVDRENLEAALASMSEAARRIYDENATCLIAPEGTRSREGGLQKFKKGAFHLAAEYDIPMVPMIMRGIEEVLPMGSIVCRRGVVRVDYLPAIDTKDWRRDRLRVHMKEVRDLFLEYVPSDKEVAGGR